MSCGTLKVGIVGIIAGVLGLPVVDGGRRREAPEGPGTPEEIQATVDSWDPMAVSLIGVIGLGLIVWLMVIKPV